MSEARRVDQNLARIAHEVLPEQVGQELRTRMRQLPSRLRGGGLAATYAFLLSKAKKEPADELSRAYRLLADKIAAHVAQRRLLKSAPPEMDSTAFLAELAKAKPAEYARASAEVDALAVWLARLADALREKPEKRRQGEDDGAR
ncbi:type III-B CRISPR module-associated protein Cmr5 [Nocardiopsis potens]|uniref:type III-B CRISPR module-associated protein Cmr5 n=1 Tax=Nocardiopsis potens TaxID=1246458 RepID=UPI000347E0E6|nr:type III-B CRISPR module-associated protein Cmr5 [Nocardiopsis potens]